MTDYALIGADGKVANIVVAELASDVAVPDGQTLLPADADAEIGGSHDGVRFVPKRRPPPPPPPPESREILALRELAEIVGADAVTAIEARFGIAPAAL